MATTRSKLGGVYPTEFIQKSDKAFHEEVKRIRSLPENRQCAECQASPSVWASVNLGVFVCMRCSQVHRNLGAHISKVKSCMGTYLWCPDEIEQMKAVGNKRAWALYTHAAPPGMQKPAVDATFEEVDAFARAKYEQQAWVHPGGMAGVLLEESAAPAARTPAAPAASDRHDRHAAAIRRDAARQRARELRARRDGALDWAVALESPPASPPADDTWGSFDAWPSKAAKPAQPSQTCQDRQIRPAAAAPAQTHVDLIDLFAAGPGPARPAPASTNDLLALFG
jgi:stromal membrane-associated protein